jgi:hypothetical protein
MFFPLNGNNVNIYALHTNATYPGDTYPEATMTHSVNTDQTTLAGYASSDLLYGRAVNVAKTNDAVPLTFYHLLSKLQVAIRPVEGLAAEDIRSVTVGGTKRMVNLTLDKLAAPAALTITSAGTASSIMVGTDVSTDFTEDNVRYNDAVIVPQTITEGTAFVTVSLTSGEELVYRLTSDAKFESGKRYTCHMTVSLTDITLSTSVSDWKPGDLISGGNGIIRYVVTYTDGLTETVYSETMGTVEFDGIGKTVRSIALPDLGYSYPIGRKDITSFTLNLDDAGKLRFRPSTDGYTPIGSVAEFQLINTQSGALAGDYRLEADLDLMSEEWMPIGSATKPFTGKFDGAGFDIDKLQINKTTSDYMALFGYVEGTYAEIKNLDIASGSVKARDYVGGICGYLYGGTISGCGNATIIGSSSGNNSSRAGGIAGYNHGGVIKACYNTGSASSSTSSTSTSSSYYSYSGGITGNNTGSITTCYNTGSAYASAPYNSYSYSGGIAGNNTGSITACYNTGSASSLANNSYSGGITGSNAGSITACYNTGSASAYFLLGGVAGSNGGSVIASYWKSGTGMPTKGVGNGVSTGTTSFTTSFTPDASTVPEWELGTGETNGWWKNYNGNDGLPQLYWE